MLRQLIGAIVARSETTNGARLQPGELQEILESLPEVTRKLRVRASRNGAPRSVCTSLKDLCEL